MKSLRVLIVDDEPHARFLIKHLLSAENDEFVSVEAEDVKNAVDIIRSGKIDLIFLDIQLRGKGAFSIIDEIGPAKMPSVIFVTAHREYAFESFQLPAVDYLLKPVDPERFKLAMSRAKERLLNKNIVRDRIGVHQGNKRIVLQVKDIIWLKAEGNYVRAFLKDANYKIRRSISVVEKQLPVQFTRIHRSIIVNVDFVQEILRSLNAKYRLILNDGTKLPLSRKYRQQLLKKLHSI
jgi:two-component system LytT family response regulator